jgi:hypothetical protein
MKFNILFCLLILSQPVFGQTTFQKIFDGGDNEEGWEIQKTADKGFILCGFTKSYGAGQNDMYVLKLDSIGNKEWDRVLGSSFSDGAYSIFETLENGYVLCGSNSSSGNDDVHVIKMNNLGNVIWENSFGGSGNDFGFKIRALEDFSFIVLGQSESYGHGGKDIYLLKIDNAGNLIFSKTYGGTQNELARDFIVTSSNEIVISATTSSYGAGAQDGYLLKVDSLGVIIWAKTYGGIDNDRFWSIEETNGGNYIISGFTESVGAGMNDAWLIETDTSGTIIWSKAYGSLAQEQMIDVIQTEDGGFATIGCSSGYGSSGNMFLIKTDVQGNEDLTRVYGGNDYSYGLSLEPSKFGYLLLGFKGSGVSAEDIYLIQTDNLGRSGCLDSLVSVGQVDFIPSISNGHLTGSGGSLISVSNNINTTSIMMDTLCFHLCATTFNSINANGVDSVKVNGIWYSQDGTYIQSLINADGCDSVLTIDVTLEFTGLNELSIGNKELIKVLDLMGRETPVRKNMVLIYVYSDGTVERKLVFN